MNDPVLIKAQRERIERMRDEALDSFIERRLDHILADIQLSNADAVGPDARHKLRGILKHYAKSPHPFRACVRDNMKRFGPGRVERVCAVVKDIIRGTTKWRGHPELDHGSPGAVAASAPPLDDDTERLLLAIPDDALEQLIFDAQEVA